jgi:hypothetical protein
MPHNREIKYKIPYSVFLHITPKYQQLLQGKRIIHITKIQALEKGPLESSNLVHPDGGSMTDQERPFIFIL